MYNQIILLYTGNYHNTVNRLYFSKTRLKKKNQQSPDFVSCNAVFITKCLCDCQKCGKA